MSTNLNSMISNMANLKNEYKDAKLALGVVPHSEIDKIKNYQPKLQALDKQYKTIKKNIDTLGVSVDSLNKQIDKTIEFLNNALNDIKTQSSSSNVIDSEKKKINTALTSAKQLKTSVEAFNKKLKGMGYTIG